MPAQFCVWATRGSKLPDVSPSQTFFLLFTAGVIQMDTADPILENKSIDKQFGFDKFKKSGEHTNPTISRISFFQILF